MKKTMLFGAVIFAVTTSAYAEKWVGFADGWYMDVDSKERKGDIGEIWLKAKREGGFVTGKVQFDCARKELIRDKEKNEIITNDSGWFEPYTAVCKKFYEIWK